MNRLRMAVVGVGALGRHHARILSELDTAELVAVAEPNATTGQAVAEKCGTRWVPDYEQLIADDCIDAVSVVVPTTYHLKVASDFLRRGIPVLVEKPLALNVEQAETLVELSEQHRTPLQVGHVERFNPAFEIAAKNCGTPKYIRGERLSPFAFRSADIGAVHDLMIHDIDLVLDLVRAPVRRVDAFGISVLGVQEDTVQARITFENGCIADLTANRVNPFFRRAMQVWSHTGCTNVDFTSREVVCYAPTETLLYGVSPLERAKQPGADIEQLKKEMFGTYIRETRPEVSTRDALTAELSSFIDAVQTGRQPRVDGHAGLRAMIVADQIVTAVAQHQWDGIPTGAIGPMPSGAEPFRKAG